MTEIGGIWRCNRVIQPCWALLLMRLHITDVFETTTGTAALKLNHLNAPSCLAILSDLFSLPVQKQRGRPRQRRSEPAAPDSAVI